jgi:hypothetical protein
MRLGRALHLFFIASLIAGLGMAVMPVTPAHAAVIPVACNVPALIAAINTAEGNGQADTMNLAAGCTYTLTAVDNVTDGPNGLPNVTTQITINGNGAIIERAGATNFRIFHIAAGGDLTLNDVTIRNGDAGAGDGGGIYNGGTLTLDSSTVSGNTADIGGGIASWGTLTVTNSTISGNTAGLAGGGIASWGTLTVTNSTISGNTVVGIPSYGGGIYSGGPAALTNVTISGNSSDNRAGGVEVNNSSTATMLNVTVADNTGAIGGGIRVFTNSTLNITNSLVANNPAGGDCSYLGTVNSGGGNLDSDGTCGAEFPNTNPLLGPLADNGGPTQTHALLAGSPAIDAGDNAACPATDQRGFPRNDGACDIGAYERGRQPPGPDEDVSEGTVGPDGLTLGDGCVKIIVEAGACPVGSIVTFDSDPSPDNSKAFGDFRLDDVLFFKVWVRGPDGAPLTEFSPPLLVCAQACRGGEGSTLFDWDEASRMWRAWPTIVQDSWHCTDWYGNLAPPPPGDQTTSGDQAMTGAQTVSDAASGAQTSADAGQTAVVEVPAAGPQVASVPSIGLPETGTPPGVSGLARIAFGVVIALGMISGGVMLGRRVPRL